MNDLQLLALITITLLVCMTLAASDFGENLKDTWVDLWCGDTQPTIRTRRNKRGEEIEFIDEPPCRGRVRGATNTALVIASSIAVVYGLFRMYKAL